MKHTTRKLLSLLMALVMVLSLVPVALAGEELSATITVDATATLENNTATVNPTVSLGDDSEYTIKTYEWTVTGEGASISDAEKVKANPAITVTQNGEITITVTGTAEKGEDDPKETATYSAAEVTVTVSGYTDPTPVATTITFSPSGNQTLTAGGSAVEVTATVKDQTGNEMSGQTVTWDSVSSTALTATSDGNKITLTPAAAANVTSRQEVTITASVTGTDAAANFKAIVNPAQTTVAVTGVSLKSTETVTVGKTVKLSATLEPANATDKEVTWSSSDETVATVAADGTVTGVKVGKATITVTTHDGGKTDTCTVTVTAAAAPTLTVTKDTTVTSMYSGGEKKLTVTATVKTGDTDITTDYDLSYAWKVGDSSPSTTNNEYTFAPVDTGTYTITCTVTATPKTGKTALETNEKSVTWTIKVSRNTNFDVSGYVNNDTEKYYLDEILDTKGNSIIEQIDAWLTKNASNYYDFNDATFEVWDDAYGRGSLYPTKKYDLDDAGGTVYFSLSKALTSTELSAKENTFYFTAEVKVDSKHTYDVGITIIVDDTAAASSSGDISYTAAIGDDVYFDAADFENFYYDKTNGGALKSVTFGSASGGVLYCDDGKLSNKTCYVDPTTKQVGLDEVYFTPTGTTAKQAKTVKIDFTAAGNKSNKTGTVTITYLNGEAKDITYSLNANGTVALKTSDFTAAYKEVTNKTAPAGMTIVFQNVPSYGDLTYADSSKTKPKDITLTSRNIKSYSFTTRSSGSNQLGDVTYSGSAGRSDTIDYIAYSNGTALFTGKVVFNGKKEVPTNLAVPFTCFGAAGTYFNAASFNAANTSVMSSATYIRFGVPAHGTLTYGNSTATGTNIYTAALGGVLYKPNAGFNGTDTVVFVVYDASGNNVGSGQVNIVVSGNAAATTPGSTGATSVDQFTDVPKTNGTAWYRDKLADLVSKGIMNGKGDGKFDPTGKVKNGEALKMILLAAGYPAQATPAGNDWAINYKNLAVSNNLISSSVVLNDDISRDAVAELAARALGLTPVTSGESPFVDSSNGYAIALYNAGIIKGDTSSGSRKFLGGDTLQRAEICVIIYAMNEYVANRYASVRPDGV